MTTRHEYTQEELDLIIDEYNKAKENNLDLDVTYQTLADTIGTTSVAIQKKLYDERRKRGLARSVSSSHRSSRRDSPLDKLKLIIGERDRLEKTVQGLREEIRELKSYKTRYSKLKEEYDEFQQMLEELNS